MTDLFARAERPRILEKAAYEARVERLRTQLLGLQERAKRAKVPVLLLVNGADGAGKGDVVNALHEWLDPRYVRTHAFGAVSDDEERHPRWWRFWRTQPPKGEIGIFFGSWYTEPIVDRVRRDIGKRAFAEELARITAMERMWVADGMLLVKLWFHVSKAQQRARFDELRADKSTRWRVTREDLANHRRYDRFRRVSALTIAMTDSEHGRWTIIGGANERAAKLTAGETVASALRARLDATPRPAPRPKPSAPVRRTVLHEIDMTARVDDDTYDAALPVLQGKLYRAVRKMKERGESLVIALEGWDAAGKGGAIRRLTPAMDARDYTIVPVAAPSEEERAQHYLWRFWRFMPERGRVAIFDRTWYGRVLVERVEGFARSHEWGRAYAEINQMEEQLTDAGTAVVKCWLHIDADEQMKRFKEREQTTWKKFKIGEEDWRNRNRWSDYVVAAHEMVQRTSSVHAPWHLVAANDKRHARLSVLRHVIAGLESRS